jgi:hypothetical protein
MEVILDHPFLEGNPLLCGRSNTQLGHFDVSRILETWKFRQERGRIGFRLTIDHERMAKSSCSRSMTHNTSVLFLQNLLIKAARARVLSGSRATGTLEQAYVRGHFDISGILETSKYRQSKRNFHLMF